MTIHRRESYQFQEFQTSETTREVSPVSSSLPVSSVAVAGHLQAYPLRPVPKRVGRWTSFVVVKPPFFGTGLLQCSLQLQVLRNWLALEKVESSTALCRIIWTPVFLRPFPFSDLGRLEVRARTFCGVDLKPVLTMAATAGNFGLGLLWSTGGSHQTCWTLLRWHGDWKHLLFPLALRMWVAWGALVQRWVNLSWSQYFIVLRWCQVMCLNRSASEEDSQHHHWIPLISLHYCCFPMFSLYTDIARQVASDGIINVTINDIFKPLALR